MDFLPIGSTNPENKPDSVDLTLSSFLPKSFPGTEKTRAIAALAFLVLATVLVGLVAGAIAYPFTASFLLIGSISAAVFMLISVIALLWKSTKIDSSDSIDIAAVPQRHQTDKLDQMSPEEFTRKISNGRTSKYQCKSNCSTISEAQFVFLGERHSTADDFVVNTHVSQTLISTSKSQIFYNEAGVNRRGAHISTNEIPRNIQFKQWDIDDNSNDYSSIYYDVGLAFQRLLEVHNNVAVNEDSFDKIEEDIGKIESQLIDKAAFTPYFQVGKENQKQNGLPKICILNARLIMIAAFITKDVLDNLNKIHKLRQNALVDSIKNAASQKYHRAFFSAGKAHFIDDANQIESTLRQYLETSGIKYYIISPISTLKKKIKPENSVERTASTTEISSERSSESPDPSCAPKLKNPTQNFDFRNLPTRFKSTKRRAMYCKLEECQAVCNDLLQKQ